MMKYYRNINKKIYKTAYDLEIFSLLLPLLAENIFLMLVLKNYSKINWLYFFVFESVIQSL